MTDEKKKEEKRKEETKILSGIIEIDLLKYFGGKMDMWRTPLIIWQALANSFGIISDDIKLDPYVCERIHRLLEGKKKIDLNKEDGSGWGELARYINPECEWEAEELTKAYNHMESPPSIDRLPILFKIEEVTMSNPFAINKLIAFRYVMQIALPLDIAMTQEEMEFGIKVWRNPSSTINKFIEICMSIVNGSTRSMMSSGIVKLLYDIVKQNTPPAFSALEVAYKEMRRENVRFCDFPQLIMYCATKYYTNILKTQGNETDIIILRAALLEDRKSNRVEELKDFISDKLPQFITERDINLMRRNHGIDIDEKKIITTVEDELNHISTHLLMNRSFYPCTSASIDIPTDIKTTAILAHDISQIPSNQLLFYGTPFNIKYLITFDELAESLEARGTFNNFLELSDEKGRTRVDDRPFPPYIRPRLSHLASERTNIPGASRLLNVMAHIYIKENKDNEVWLELSKSYKSVPHVDKSKFSNIENYKKEILIERQKLESHLRHTIDIGMLMRGWDGKDRKDYPIEYVPDLDEKVEGRRQSDVNERVSYSFYILESNLNKSGWKELYDKLPLCRYSRSMFIKPNGNDATLTLRARLDLVKKGDTRGTSTDSCIRMSSNYIISTAIRALQLMELPIPFSLSRLYYSV